jgi:hypothetical protein
LVKSRGAYIAAPYWFLLAVLGLPFILRALARLRMRRRCIQRGLCPVCGYDLRATAGRCPECGAVPHGTGRGSGLSA